MMLKDADDDLSVESAAPRNLNAGNRNETEEEGEEGEEDAGCSSGIEMTTFKESSVWFYQIPRHASTSDPRAEHWNPDKPLLTGSIKIILKGEECFIRLFEPKKSVDSNEEEKLFAQCPVVITREMHLGIHVQDCADSSRYFVIRVQDEVSKRHAFVGIGFPDRSQAFNFKAALQDYVRSRKRDLEIENFHEREKAATSSRDGNSDNAAASSASLSFSSEGLFSSNSNVGDHAPKRDFSIHTGQTIHLNIPYKQRESTSTSSSTSASKLRSNISLSSATAGVLLAPPPPPPPPAAAAAAATVAVDETDEWGDFQ